MVSRFSGRDYNNIREEIISFLRQQLPIDWDYTNLADPIVIYAESLARVCDQLHFTIDELRRECDIATAQRRSSIYSYALREGYRMMLPKASFGIISVNSLASYRDINLLNNHLHLSIKPFDKIKVTSISGASLYAINTVDADLQTLEDPEYTNKLYNLADNETDPIVKHKRFIDYATYSLEKYNRTQRISVVLGNKKEFNFNYSNINRDSTVILPEPLIDRDAIRLTVTDKGVTTEWKCVNDIIAAGFVGNYYSITPKFTSGSITLCIEFPTNYRDLFTPSATFKLEYIQVVNQFIDSPDIIDITDYLSPADGYPDAEVNKDYISLDIGNGIRGYTEYEDPSITRVNYKQLTQNYSALLTKSDYTNYIKSTSTSNCKVFDHSDNYKENILPPSANLLPRVLYILTDAPYSERERLFYDLQERSSRSDCLFMVPYGKDPYTIIVKADCFLLGTSISSISTKIKTALLKYYSEGIGDVVPNESMISYIVHKASDKVAVVNSAIVRDTTFGTLSDDFSNVNNYSNNDIDDLFNAIKNDNCTFKLSSTNEQPLLGYIPKILPIIRRLDDDSSIYVDENNKRMIIDPSELVEDDTNPDILKYFSTKHNTTLYVNINGVPVDKDGNTILINENGNPIDEDGNIIYVDDLTKPYNKYPTIKFNNFPNEFPKIYFKGDTSYELSSYDDIIKHQTVYSTDNPSWDISDDKLFTVERKHIRKYLYPYIHTYNDKESPTDIPANEYTLFINDIYSKHHYMMPFLNRVIILIKAVGN